MICVVRLKEGKISGWMIGTDMHDLRRKAMAIGDNELANQFSKMEFVPSPGQYDLRDGITLLVE